MNFLVHSDRKGIGRYMNIHIFPHLGYFWDANLIYIMIIEHIETTQRSGKVDGVCAFMRNII